MICRETEWRQLGWIPQWDRHGAFVWFSSQEWFLPLGTKLPAPGRHLKKNLEKQKLLADKIIRAVAVCAAFRALRGERP